MSKRGIITVRCADGKTRKFHTPVWMRFMFKKTLFGDNDYFCAHCGDKIDNTGKGQLKLHTCNGSAARTDYS
jgi:hypothetical protein